MLRLSLFLNVVVVMLLVASCTPKKKSDPFNNVNNINNTNNVNTCTSGTKQCFGNTLQVCANNQWTNEAICTDPTRVCDPTNLRCQACVSNGTTCGSDNAVHICTADGTVGLVQTQCDSLSGEQCVEVNGVAACDSPCIRAASTKSYRGCDYWLVSMANPGLGATTDWLGEAVAQYDFDDDFGVVVDNSQNESPALVTIMNGTQTLANESIAAGATRVFLLPYNLDLRQAEAGQLGEHADIKSGIYRAATSDGGFHLTSSLPVTVYQFNPYNYEKDGAFSYSNDASLILPSTVLSQNYIVMARPTLVLFTTANALADYVPGLLTVVATDDNTQVTVRSKAYTIAGPSVGALTPGSEMQFALNKGDVLQLVSAAPTSNSACEETFDVTGAYFCSPNSGYDLTGTEIEANKPVGVWGGHVCDFVPYHSAACDHLEEMMFPLQTWGKEFFVGLTKKVQAGSTETNLIKILAGADGAQITFNPSTVHAPLNLNRGQFVEFLMEQDVDFKVSSNMPIMVGKFTVGQNYWTESYDEMGDPAFGLVVPEAQYRNEYSFITPESMTVNYVNVIALIQTDGNGTITLDGQVIPWADFAAHPIGDTGYGIVKIDVTSTGTNGAHIIYSSSDAITFGIEVYGFASYTSYLYPGGLDLEYINPIGK